MTTTDVYTAPIVSELRPALLYADVAHQPVYMIASGGLALVDNDTLYVACPLQDH